VNAAELRAVYDKIMAPVETAPAVDAPAASATTAQ